MWIYFIAGENCEVPIQQARVEQLLLEWKPLKHSDSRESLRRLISRKKRFLSLAVYTNALPLRTEREGITVTSAPRERSRYCLSYTAIVLNFLPCGSVPRVVTVRVLPSADTAIRPVTVTFPPFLTVNAKVRALTCL